MREHERAFAIKQRGLNGQLKVINYKLLVDILYLNVID